jgi:hypothetical protein
MQIVQEVIAFVSLTAAFLIAVGVIFSRIGWLKGWSHRRFKGWLDGTVGEVVQARLTDRNGGSSIMDAVDRIENDIRQLHGSHAETLAQVDRLSSQVAVLRQIADERGDAARQRDDTIDRRLDQLTQALLSARTRENTP